MPYVKKAELARLQCAARDLTRFQQMTEEEFAAFKKKQRFDELLAGAINSFFAGAFSRLHTQTNPIFDRLKQHNA